MLRMVLYRRLSILLLSAVTLFAVISCRTPVVETGGGFEVVKEYGSEAEGYFTIKLSKTQISTAEELALVLETKADENLKAVFPEIQGALEKFRVLESSEKTRRLDRDGKLISTRAYTLEPFLPGDYIIPPLEISFENGNGFYSPSLISEEISVKVSSVLPPLLGEQDIEPITGPAVLQRDMLLWMVIAGIITAAAATALFYVARQRYARKSAQAERGPLESALKELEFLLSKKLIEKGSYREFYDGISGLTRRYIERRFSIRAPEQTTEEFLESARHSIELSEYTGLLGEFLSGCDLVKFALYEPSSEEVERAVQSCESFLTGTAPRKTVI